MTRIRRLGLPLLILGLALAAYPAWVAFNVWTSSHKDEVHTADAIVVLGAAQYNGEPSPVFRARLDQAAYLYEEQMSTLVIVTGGKRPGDRFTEAEAGGNYLVGEGIPAEAIVPENVGTTTWESLQRVRQIASTRQLTSLLFVSDPLHSERLKRMAHDLGFTQVFTSPASYVELNRSRATKLRELVHEVGSILVYEIYER